MIITYPGQTIPQNEAFQRQVREFNPENLSIQILLYKDRMVLLRQAEGQSWILPYLHELQDKRVQFEPALQIGSWQGQEVAIGAWKDEELENFGPFKWVNLRALFAYPEQSLLGMIGYGNQMLQWDLTSRYCGKCGGANRFDAPEGGKICQNCSHKTYTRISPAVIVAVVKEGKLLLAQSPRHRGKFHTVLAGFVEPGESLEETVIREIKEEVSIDVGNIRYFGSQSWPFPDSLMVGFMAEYQSGDLIPDQVEISHAAWYGPEELPVIPPPASIAHHLIQAFVKEYRV